MKVDFVLPWVNPLDTNWQQLMTSYQPLSPNTNYENNTNKDSCRFRDLGTLKYVLRSIEHFCPWYNKIILITMGHYPEWLNINHHKIQLIRHDEFYFNQKHLPIFNSSSIEMNLANIPNLADYLVYLNDDTLITHQLPIERFFVDGKAVDFIAHGWIPRNKLFMLLRGKSSWVYALKNNLQLINSLSLWDKIDKNSLYHPSYSLKNKISNFLMINLYGQAFWLEHWHHPQAYTKKTLQNVQQAFSDEMAICSANRFRSDSDLTHYLYRYWHLAHNDFYPTKHNDGIVLSIDKLKSINILQDYINNSLFNFICINDSSSNLSQDNFNHIQKSIINILDNFLPQKATFEL